MTEDRKTHSPENIRELLIRSDKAVERAVLAIFARQTNLEQEYETTRFLNGVGFSAAHAHLGSYLANWLKSGKRLSGEYLNKARQMMLKYTRQLSEIAEEKAHDFRSK